MVAFGCLPLTKILFCYKWLTHLQGFAAVFVLFRRQHGPQTTTEGGTEKTIQHEINRQIDGAQHGRDLPDCLEDARVIRFVRFALKQKTEGCASRNHVSGNFSDQEEENYRNKRNCEVGVVLKKQNMQNQGSHLCPILFCIFINNVKSVS